MFILILYKKFWKYFSDTMRATFPEEEGLKNKQVVCLLKKLLCVEEHGKISFILI